ncbi:TPA: hypothetical protein ACGXQC_000855 [Bacillus cereus]|uniref:hypothetical protein n=1 Tax=Bacillus cereus TaxID=1396 RepID=UPI000BF4394A|nr:hypothetical protein [Bacillus cereus]PEX66992.1 hypothetical protein CN460_24720 [Bacillus cereus]
MTLIAGIILGNGILMVSDSRETFEDTSDVFSEYRRKITFVTPAVTLGTTGYDSTFHAARILRRSLYNNWRKNTIEDQRKFILDFYRHVNLLHLANRTLQNPVGDILVAEYDATQNKYTLLSNDGMDHFKEFTIHNQIRDTVLVGANKNVRDTTKSQIKDILQSLNDTEINCYEAQEYVAKECQKIFKHQASEYPGINDKLYCVYSSTLNGQPAVAVYLIESDGTLHNLDKEQDGEDIILPIKK